MAQPGVPTDRDGPRPDSPLAHEVELRRAIDEGRLRLTGLDGSTRRLATMALTVAVASAAVVLGASLGIQVPGGSLEVPGVMVAEPGARSVPVVAVTAFLLGLAALGAVMTASALAIPRRSSWLVLAGCAAASAAAAAPALAALSAAAVIADVDPISWWALAAGGGAAIGASAVLVLAAPFAPRIARAGNRARSAVVALAGIPGMALAVAFLAGLTGGVSIPEPRPAGFETYPDTLHLASAAIASSVYGTLARLLPLLMTPIVLWEAATWARASRAEFAAPLVRRVDVRPWLLPAVLTAKLTWLTLGFAGLLPASLGGASPAWQASRDAGVLAWALAAAWAVGAAAWLAGATSPPVDERSIRPGLRFLVGGFSAGSVAGATILLAGAVLLLLPDDTLGLAAFRGAGTAGELTIWLQVLTAVIALVAGVVLLRRGSRAGALLAVAGAWIAPRAAFVTATALGVVPTDADSPAAVDLATLDAVLTVAIAIVAIRWLSGRRQGADLGGLALALVVSTLMAHGGTLVPVAAGTVLATSAILFPPFRALVFGSAEANADSPARDARVLMLVGRLAAVLLLVAGTYAVVGVRPPDGTAELGRLLFGPPFAALLVGAAITSRRSLRARRRLGAEDPGVDGSGLRPTPRHVAGVAAGVASVLTTAILAGLVLDPTVGWAWQPTPAPSAPVPASSPTAPPPTDAEVFRAFVGEVGGRMDTIAAIFTGPLQSARGDDLAAVGDALAARADEALAWRRDQALRPCLAPYATAVDRYFQAAGDVGRSVAAFARGQVPEAAVVVAFDSVGAALDEVASTLEAAGDDCGARAP